MRTGRYDPIAKALAMVALALLMTSSCSQRERPETSQREPDWGLGITDQAPKLSMDEIERIKLGLNPREVGEALSPSRPLPTSASSLIYDAAEGGHYEFLFTDSGLHHVLYFPPAEDGADRATYILPEEKRGKSWREAGDPAKQLQRGNRD